MGKKNRDRIDTFGNASFVKNPEPETDANTIDSKYLNSKNDPR